MEELKQVISDKLNEGNRTVSITVPYSAGELLAYIHEICLCVQSQEYGESGTRISAVIPAKELGRLEARMARFNVEFEA